MRFTARLLPQRLLLLAATLAIVFCAGIVRGFVGAGLFLRSAWPARCCGSRPPRSGLPSSCAGCWPASACGAAAASWGWRHVRPVRPGRACGSAWPWPRASGLGLRERRGGHRRHRGGGEAQQRAHCTGRAAGDDGRAVPVHRPVGAGWLGRRAVRWPCPHRTARHRHAALGRVAPACDARRQSRSARGRSRGAGTIPAPWAEPFDADRIDQRGAFQGACRGARRDRPARLRLAAQTRLPSRHVMQAF